MYRTERSIVAQEAPASSQQLSLDACSGLLRASKPNIQDTSMDRIEDNDAMIHSCSLEINQLQHDMQGLRKANEDGLNKIKDWNREVGDWCDDLETRVAKCEAGLSKLEQGMKQISRKVDHLSEQVGEIASAVARIEGLVMVHVMSRVTTCVGDMEI
ncbi:hypothetical protein BGZ63DRAFT_459961 [Mariannaea sp. PMI_226]|nr:hypothetical protein BGZ63DRAFT_459961 [Mariannaea sp. PMI_226]